MALSVPIRIDNDVYQSAKAAAPDMDRSAAQQISHWARLGREVEESRGPAHREVVAVLAGEAHYDDLEDPRSQAIVRAVWAEHMKQWRESLNLKEQFEAEGRSYVEMGEDGQPVIRESDAEARASG